MLAFAGSPIKGKSGALFWLGGIDARTVAGADQVTSITLDTHVDMLAEQLAAGKLDLAALMRDGVTATIHSSTIANSEHAGEINLTLPDAVGGAVDGAYGSDALVLP